MLWSSSEDGTVNQAATDRATNLQGNAEALASPPLLHEWSGVLPLATTAVTRLGLALSSSLKASRQPGSRPLITKCTALRPTRSVDGASAAGSAAAASRRCTCSASPRYAARCSSGERHLISMPICRAGQQACLVSLSRLGAAFTCAAAVGSAPAAAGVAAVALQLLLACCCTVLGG